MVTTQVEELLRRLKTGVFDPADVHALERTTPAELLAELDARYSIRFQERRVGRKWEVSVAHSLHFELTVAARKSPFPMVFIVPVYRSCLFLSGEEDRITGISVATRLRVRPIRAPFQGLAVSTGPGFKLDRTPDGWHIKPITKRTVKLADDFLLKRGWRFDALQQFAPKS